MTMLDINVSLLLPEIFLSISILGLLLYGVFLETPLSVVYKITNVILLIVFCLICTIPFEKQLTLHNAFISDSFSVLLKLVLVICTLYVLNLSHYSLLRSSVKFYEYPILMLCSLLGMMIMVSAHDLLIVFMGLELQTLPLYVLTAIRRDDAKSAEAGLKYFVLGALASGLMLYGISFMYGYTGTLEFNAIHEVLKSLEFGKPVPIELGLSLVFLLGGLFFKISAVPFHMWTPDVYEGSPTGIIAFLSTVPKVAAIGLIIRLLIMPLYPLIHKWQYFLMAISVVSMIWGSLAALFQKNIKRLLAYSSINNIGYALMGILVGTSQGVSSSMLHIILYSLMMIALWGALMFVSNQGVKVEVVDDLKGIFKVMPSIGVMMGFLLFSLAGIPPLVGFLGKFYVFLAVVEKHFYFLAIIGVITSSIAAGYYLLLIKKIIIDVSEEKIEIGRMTYSSFAAVAAYLLLLSLCIFLGIVFIKPHWLLTPITQSTMCLFN